MALLTPLSPDDAARVAAEYQLGAVHHIEAIAAGSVNSNFVLTTDAGRVFCRLYEEQDARGVAFEWRLLDHLTAKGIPVPARRKGPAPDELSVRGKPVGVFEVIAGRELCHREVTAEHLASVGKWLARVHLASEGFEIAGRDRFDRNALRERLRTVPLHEHPELAADVARLHRVLDETAAPVLPQGIVHGDLFRDNVRWQGESLLAILDWESALRGTLVYDLAVVMLAWTYTDTFVWPLARSLVQGYHAVRPLTAAEREGFEAVCAAACARFATTRITDYYLRRPAETPGYRAYQRFLSRLDQVQRYAPGAMMAALLDGDQNP